MLPSSKDGKILDYSSTSLHSADCVSIAFERQKNDWKANTVTQWRTSDDLLRPVKIWASITERILSCQGANKNLPVSLAKYKINIIKLTAEMIADVCQDRVVAIGETKLGIL